MIETTRHLVARKIYEGVTNQLWTDLLPMERERWAEVVGRETQALRTRIEQLTNQLEQFEE